MAFVFYAAIFHSSLSVFVFMLFESLYIGLMLINSFLLKKRRHVVVFHSPIVSVCAGIFFNSFRIFVWRGKRKSRENALFVGSDIFVCFFDDDMFLNFIRVKQLVATRIMQQVSFRRKLVSQISISIFKRASSDEFANDRASGHCLRRNQRERI